MNKKILALMLSGALVLTACDGKPSNASSANATSQTAETTPVETAPIVPVELKSANGKISVTTKGTFTDKSQDPTALPDGMKAEQLLLLQTDELNDVTIYAVDLGKAKVAKDYFAKLKSALETDKTLTNLTVGEAKDGRMSYAFSQADADGNAVFNEACVAILDKEQVYSVCANSADVAPDELSAALSDVKIAK